MPSPLGLASAAFAAGNKTIQSFYCSSVLYSCGVLQKYARRALTNRALGAKIVAIFSTLTEETT
jgi:hypothetical protein